MTHFQFKGKGVLVPVYATVPFFGWHILIPIANNYFFQFQLPPGYFEFVTGISLITSGIWIYLTSDNYYLDENGEKQYVYLENEFMFIRMKIWGYIFGIIGGLAMIGGILIFIE